jgi:hypothetical protein
MESGASLASDTVVNSPHYEYSQLVYSDPDGLAGTPQQKSDLLRVKTLFAR